MADAEEKKVMVDAIDEERIGSTLSIFYKKLSYKKVRLKKSEN